MRRTAVLKLRLCPHCAGRPLIVGEGRRWKSIKCEDCGCSTPKSARLDEVVEKWNARINRKN